MSSSGAGDTNTLMQAVVQDRYGGSEVLRLASVARPQIKDHEVLVRVHAAGLTAAPGT